MKHHLTRPRWTALVLIVILLGAAWLPRLPAQAANARLDGAPGPQLFRIKAAAEPQVELAASGLVVHTRLADESLLASGPSAAAAALRSAGLAFDLLAANTQGQVYYLVDAQAPQAATQAARFGPIIYQASLELLVAVPLASEQAFVETLPAAGIAIALVPNSALLSEPAAAPFSPPASTDPVIVALLNRLTSAALSDRIADLSGVRPVAIGGSSVMLTTR